MSTKRDFLETEKTPGWEHFKAKVEEAIAHHEVELRTLDTDGKTAEAVGLAHVRLEERIAGLRRALNVANDIKKEPADDLD